MEDKDVYFTVEEAFIGDYYKEKGSKFLGYVFPVKTELDIEKFIAQVRAEHHKARHWCYAWQLGTDKIRFRANDDGEPNNSAGQPIYGQILSKNLTNVLVIVVRYYGGTKLGVGGLVSAYKLGALYALDKALIIKKTMNDEKEIEFEYKDMDKVLRILNANTVEILDRKMEFNCRFALSIRKRDTEKIIDALEKLRCVTFLKEED